MTKEAHLLCKFPCVWAFKKALIFLCMVNCVIMPYRHSTKSDSAHCTIPVGTLESIETQERTVSVIVAAPCAFGGAQQGHFSLGLSDDTCWWPPSSGTAPPLCLLFRVSCISKPPTPKSSVPHSLLCSYMHPVSGMCVCTLTWSHAPSILLFPPNSSSEERSMTEWVRESFPPLSVINLFSTGKKKRAGDGGNLVVKSEMVGFFKLEN